MGKLNKSTKVFGREKRGFFGGKDKSAQQGPAVTTNNQETVAQKIENSEIEHSQDKNLVEDLVDQAAGKADIIDEVNKTAEAIESSEDMSQEPEEYEESAQEVKDLVADATSEVASAIGEPEKVIEIAVDVEEVTCATEAENSEVITSDIAMKDHRNHATMHNFVIPYTDKASETEVFKQASEVFTAEILKSKISAIKTADDYLDFAEFIKCKLATATLWKLYSILAKTEVKILDSAYATTALTDATSAMNKNNKFSAEISDVDYYVSTALATNELSEESGRYSKIIAVHSIFKKMEII